MIGKRYAFCDIDSWGLKSLRYEITISGMEIFCMSTLTRRTRTRITGTRRARTRIAGTMGIYISSKLSWIPLPVSPPFDTRIMGSVSSSKVSAVIPLWLLHQIICSVVRPKRWLHSNSTATWAHRRMAKWSGQSRKSSKGFEHRCYHGPKQTCSVSRVLSRSWTTSQRALLFWEPMGPWWAKFPNIYRLNHGNLLHSRWFRLRYTIAWDPDNCGSRSRWWCGYQCDMERCTRTFCRRQLVQVIRLGPSKHKCGSSPGWAGLRKTQNSAYSLNRDTCEGS